MGKLDGKAVNIFSLAGVGGNAGQTNDAAEAGVTSAGRPWPAAADS